MIHGIHMHEEEGQAPEIRDRRLYQEAKEKIGRWVRKWLDGGHAARKEGDDNVWRTVIKATGTISGDTRYEGDRERGASKLDPAPARGLRGKGEAEAGTRHADGTDPRYRAREAMEGQPRGRGAAGRVGRGGRRSVCRWG